MIQCRGISKVYKKTPVLQEVNLTVEDGRITFLMGENGAGKTTLIKCMMGLEQHEGACLFDGLGIDEVHDQCMVIFDDCPFYTNLSGFENLRQFTAYRFSKQEIKEAARHYMGEELLRAKVGQYSYGQKKKLALALTELLRPKYLVMDEVSNGLDYETMRNLKKTIRRWSETCNILLTGHQFEFYNDMIQDLYLLKDGKAARYTNDEQSGFHLGEIYDEKLG